MQRLPALATRRYFQPRQANRSPRRRPTLINGLLRRSIPLSLALLTSTGYAQSLPGLSLQDAIQQAESGPLAQQGQDRIDVAQGMVRQAGLRPNPRLFLQSEDLQPWSQNFNFPNTTENYGYLSQALELGGKRAGRLAVARASLHQTEAERELLRQRIAGRVAGAYWAAVVSLGVTHLLQRDMTAVDGIVEYNRKRVDAGATRGVDLLRVQIERDRVQLLLASAQREAVATRLELFRQMGRAPETVSGGKDVPLTDSLEAMKPIATETMESVLAARADVAVARDAVSTAEADVQLQRALGVPDLDLLGGYKRNIGANTLYTGLQIPLPFSNRNQGEIERARAAVHLAQDQLRDLEISVRAEVQEAQTAYTEQQHVVRDILPDMRGRARQNLDIMDDAYRTGGVDLLHFLDAERTDFDVEVAALRTLAEFQQAALRLQLVYGGRP